MRYVKEFIWVVIFAIFIIPFVIYQMSREGWEWMLMRLGVYDFISKRPLLNFILSTKWNLKIASRWHCEKHEWIDFANFRKGK